MGISNEIMVSICMGTGGVAAGAKEVFEKFSVSLESQQVKAVITERKCQHKMHQTGCRGLCALDLLVDIIVPGLETKTYAHVTTDMVERIINEHIIDHKPVEEWLVTSDYHKFYEKQVRLVLSRCGSIDPESIEDYQAEGGYEALAKALKMEPQAVIDEVKKSGLRGRGGGGFSTGLKWELCRKAEGDQKYIIVNADEGDPGAFMDRSVLEGDPHAVLEGLIIGGYAIGATRGYIYARAEYPLAIKRLEIAIEQARQAGFIGKNILESGFDFELSIYKGAGAFVCGEETALMASIEGFRGMPRPRPPYPAVKGLWGKPTNINNVETFANVPYIIANGGDKYAGMGTEKSKGSKVFALTGKIKNTGLVEVPMGISLREIVYDVCGGMYDENVKFKAAQMGGPSGGLLPESLLDTPIDYDSLVSAGAMMGSGGIVVMDEANCMIDIARFFLNFTTTESCGKCVPCRIGTRRMLEILTRICDGEGTMHDLDELEELARRVKATALCGLGTTAPNPVLSTMRYFKHEYLEHINEKRCAAKACKNLIAYHVDAEKCVSCALCLKACSSDAIKGGKKGLKAVIQNDKCIRCGACIEKCTKQNAIVIVDRYAADVEVGS